MSGDNPQAFPNTGNSNWNLHPSEGMSLRDWFAGQALVGLLQIHSELVAGESAFAGHESLAAHDAYRFADAMLAARKEPVP